jgi:hypothetical protein
MCALLAASCILIPVGCSGSSGTDTRTVEFTLTPDGGSQFVVEVDASTHAPTTGACELDLLDIEGDNRYLQWGIGGNCVGMFDATIEHQGTVYLLFGTVLREFGTGSGPFASGTYSTEDGLEFGTFTFHELEFHDSN